MAVAEIYFPSFHLKFQQDSQENYGYKCNRIIVKSKEDFILFTEKQGFYDKLTYLFFSSCK